MIRRPASGWSPGRGERGSSPPADGPAGPDPDHFRDAPARPRRGAGRGARRGEVKGRQAPIEAFACSRWTAPPPATSDGSTTDGRPRAAAPAARRRVRRGPRPAGRHLVTILGAAGGQVAPVNEFITSSRDARLSGAGACRTGGDHLLADRRNRARRDRHRSGLCRPATDFTLDPSRPRRPRRAVGLPSLSARRSVLVRGNRHWRRPRGPFSLS